MNTIKLIITTLGKIGVALSKTHQLKKKAKQEADSLIGGAEIDTLLYLKHLRMLKRRDVTKEEKLAKEWMNASFKIKDFSTNLYKLCQEMAYIFTNLDLPESTIEKTLKQIDGVTTTRKGNYTYRLKWNTLEMEAISKAGKRSELFRGRDIVKKKSLKKATHLQRGLWSKSDINMLKKLFPNTKTVYLTTKLGRSTGAVKKKASRMGLKKSKKYMKSLGRI